MQITLDKKSLVNELTVMKKIAGQRSNLAICNNVATTITSQGVIFQVTNLETAYVTTMGGYCKVDANYDPANSITIPVSNLMRAVKAVPKKQDTVSLAFIYDDSEDGAAEPWGMKINDTISIVGRTIQDFPEFPAFPHTLTSYPVFTQSNLKKISGINAAADEKRAHITGLFLDFQNSNLAKTDGNRLNVVDMAANNNVPYDNTLMPVKVVDCLLSPQLNNRIGNVTVKDQHLYVETGYNSYLTTRILEGEFPEQYLEIVDSAGHDSILSVADKTELIETILEAYTITDEDYRFMHLHLNDKCKITTTNPNIGEFSKHVENFTYAGESIEIGLNPRYVVEALNCLDETGANLFFRGADHALIIPSPDETFVAAIMPTRI